MAQKAAEAASDKKASDIVILDLGELIGITDFFVLCSAGNERQLGVVVEEVEARLRDDGHRPLRREGQKETGWMLLDYGPIVVHAFTEEQRRFYALERLWADAPTTTFDDAPRTPAAAGRDAGSDQR